MDRTNSMGLCRYARDYSDAGRVVSEKLVSAVAPTPAYYLYCHAIELVLKAYLRGSGLSLEELKKIGHDLSGAYKRALDARLNDKCKLTPEMEQAIELVNPIYRDKEFEYIKIGARTIPTIDILREISELLILSLERFCYEKMNVHS
jgi:hypothetical protein